MRLSVTLVIILGSASLLGLVASFPVEASYRNRAQLVQRIKRDPAAELFGEKGVPVGTPQRLIIDDPKAFLDGSSPEGAKFVDEGYLETNGIYPLQLKTVEYVLSLSRIGMAILAAISGGLAMILRRRIAANR